ncbi:hypothetical protein [Metaclostridioides mangenotii]|uniref:hypothetical protein n=1 Tax=Metaclostridioides mangenotii TaxID=1540 RepID=UPI0026EDE791|nr:hypothetical protein [Clostridioides mangenotii]
MIIDSTIITLFFIYMYTFIIYIEVIDELEKKIGYERRIVEKFREIKIKMEHKLEKIDNIYFLSLIRRIIIELISMRTYNLLIVSFIFSSILLGTILESKGDSGVIIFFSAIIGFMTIWTYTRIENEESLRIRKITMSLFIVIIVFFAYMLRIITVNDDIGFEVIILISTCYINIENLIDLDREDRGL